ncbi:hypothetical protein ACJIZ3_017509 [Penstemon smallii]|uniref:Uncharacterized protein n=1 Tax=Penstemon smallii TaxID=265156 RepID=A0ABD3SVQ9_9LAMI
MNFFRLRTIYRVQTSKCLFIFVYI